MTIWLTSDWHFQHELAAKKRGFSSPNEHDETVIGKMNALIKADDTVFMLGDVVFNANKKGWRENLKLVDKIGGHKHLIVGNHDRCSPNRSNAWKYKGDFLKYFESVSEFARLSAAGRDIMLSHYPYDESSLAFNHELSYDSHRFDQFVLPDMGKLIVHGHTHTSTFLTQSQKGTPQVNVNLEATELKPVSLDEIVKRVYG